MNTKIEFTRIKNDINGNPRYVCHFLDMLTENEAYNLNLSDAYKLAIKRANNIGGRKYNTKKLRRRVSISVVQFT